jgi:hypothetical protein
LWWGAIAWAAAALLILEPARSGLTYGQIEALLMLAILVDALVIPPPYKGIVIGITSAIKLTPLIFVLFLLVRDGRSAIRAGASFVAVTALAWLTWPKESASFWLHDVFKPGRVGGVSYVGNQSWFGVLHRPPFLHTGSLASWLALCLITLLIGTYVSWRSVVLGSPAHGLVAMALTGLLISPISWTHHWVWVLLIPPVLVAGRHPLHRTVRGMLWGLVVLAVLAPYLWLTSGAAADILDDSLALWGFAALSCWAVSLRFLSGSVPNTRLATSKGSLTAVSDDPVRRVSGMVRLWALLPIAGPRQRRPAIVSPPQVELAAIAPSDFAVCHTTPSEANPFEGANGGHVVGVAARDDGSDAGL